MKKSDFILAMLGLLATAAIGCRFFEIPDPVEPEDTASCGMACERMENMPLHPGSDEIGCVESKPLETGQTCTEFCEGFQREGIQLRPSCVVKLEYCSEIETCF